MTWSLGLLSSAEWQFDALDDDEWRIARDLLHGEAMRRRRDPSATDEQVGVSRDGIYLDIVFDHAAHTATLVSVWTDDDERAAARVRNPRALHSSHPPPDSDA